MKRDPRLFTFVTLGIVILCAVGTLLAVILSTPPRPPGPQLYPEPPIYGGATDVEVRKSSEMTGTLPLGTERLISFKTGDAPQAVLLYYEEILSKAGWRMFEKIDPNTRSFYWTDGTALTGLYKINVTAMPSTQGGTNVTVETGSGFDDR